MTLPAGLIGPIAKVERAKQHIRDLQAAREAFLNARPYRIGIKEDAQAGKRLYYLADVSDPDPNLAAIVGDTLHNLRSSLDHLAYRLVVVGLGADPSDPTYIYYPIADSAAKYPSHRDAHVKGMRQEAIDAIDATKPYAGGNDTLWRIHKLNNIDKHRLLIAVGSMVRSVDIGSDMTRRMRKAFPDRTFPNMSVFYKLADPMFPLKQGDVLTEESIDEDVNQNLESEVRFDVALGEPGILQGQAVIEALQQMADLVDGIVRSFAALV